MLYTRIHTHILHILSFIHSLSLANNSAAQVLKLSSYIINIKIEKKAACSVRAQQRLTLIINTRYHNKNSAYILHFTFCKETPPPRYPAHSFPVFSILCKPKINHGMRLCVRCVNVCMLGPYFMESTTSLSWNGIVNIDFWSFLLNRFYCVKCERRSGRLFMDNSEQCIQALK